jgi:hypothetical protein
MMSIVMLACILLRLQQPVMDFNEELVVAGEEIVNGLCLSRALLIW